MLPQIVTSFWFGKVPPDHIKVGISRGVPRGLPAGYRLYKKLAPGPWFNSVSSEVYRDRYFEGLNAMDPQQVVNDLLKLGNGRVPVLCCYEKPEADDQWCHRGMVSAWLHDKLGLVVPELGMENRGYGWAHPKLPREFRKQPEPAPAATPLDVSSYVGSKATDAEGLEWTLIGRDPANADQALAQCGDRYRSFSRSVMESKFEPRGEKLSVTQ